MILRTGTSPYRKHIPEGPARRFDWQLTIPPNMGSCRCHQYETCQNDVLSNMLKADSTLRSSQAVPHPSTNRALRRLTSEVRRDPVYSTRYGRQRDFWYPTAHLAISGFGRMEIIGSDGIETLMMSLDGITGLGFCSSFARHRARSTQDFSKHRSLSPALQPKGYPTTPFERYWACLIAACPHCMKRHCYNTKNRLTILKC